jgi:hypothetical protein
MNSSTRGTTSFPRNAGIGALRSAFAVLAVAGTLYAHDSNAVLVMANGTYQAEWYIGEAVPSIDVYTDFYVVEACGAELAWVYTNFPTISNRTLGASTLQRRTAVAAPPAENVCVIWRGDEARFIADNLDLMIQ